MSPGCLNSDSRCEIWKGKGYCTQYGYVDAMAKHCKKSCEICKPGGTLIYLHYCFIDLHILNWIIYHIATKSILLYYTSLVFLFIFSEWMFPLLSYKTKQQILTWRWYDYACASRYDFDFTLTFDYSSYFDYTWLMYLSLF